MRRPRASKKPAFVEGPEVLGILHKLQSTPEGALQTHRKTGTLAQQIAECLHLAWPAFGGGLQRRFLCLFMFVLTYF